MALGDLVQVGVNYKVGFQGMSYTGYIPEDGLSLAKDVANEEINTDIRGAVTTHIYTNPGMRINMTLKILATASDTLPPSKGDIITFTPPEGGSAVGFLVESASSTYNRNTTTCQMTVLREDSMQTTLDA